MRLIYKPEGGEEKSWDFKPEKLLSPEAEAIEKVTDWTFEQFGEKFIAGSTTAKRALLWVMLKRESPTLRYTEVSFALGEVTTDFDAEERGKMREELDTNTDLNDEQRKTLEDYLAGYDDKDVDESAGPKDDPGESSTLTAVAAI